ncbi:uncharacterized protein B0J16DRAFT_387004 [Fusarium flagelliforme]|uniref:uncharacterized protein n=1 Tax=Fusarium flagelliforme TaxID=2675880 RepID=UPI001E8DD7AF|nr:uncharacterized protein B0J16DRAFT_387004 [Fusarium flagelliforme]KAH7179173.1 hypothetical protein B0J16DRAFT_387004 [Fusarium flagelliforme]
MSQTQQLPDSEGLQVDTHAEQAAKAPEVAGYNQNGHYYVSPEYQSPAPQGQRPPFGLGLWAFAGLVALLTAIVVGAGVGGGLGAALANKSSDCSADSAVDAPRATAEPTSCPTLDNSTSTENATAPYVPRSPSKVENLELDCPDKLNDETRYKSNKGYEFKWWCGVNAPQGDKAKEGGVVFDYLSFFAYSIDDCMEACGNMNQKDDENHTGLRCKSIVFSKRMSADYDAQNGNCWLKNASKSAGGNWGFKEDFFAYAELND